MICTLLGELPDTLTSVKLSWDKGVGVGVNVGVGVMVEVGVRVGVAVGSGVKVGGGVGVSVGGIGVGVAVGVAVGVGVGVGVSVGVGVGEGTCANVAGKTVGARPGSGRASGVSKPGGRATGVGASRLQPMTKAPATSNANTKAHAFVRRPSPRAIIALYMAEAAVDIDSLAGKVIGSAGCQIQRQQTNLSGVSHAPQWDVFVLALDRGPCFRSQLEVGE